MRVMRFMKRFNCFSDIILYVNIGVQWQLLQLSLFISNGNPFLTAFSKSKLSWVELKLSPQLFKIDEVYRYKTVEHPQKPTKDATTRTTVFMI